MADNMLPPLSNELHGSSYVHSSLYPGEYVGKITDSVQNDLYYHHMSLEKQVS